ncbi:MAG: preprotein translocase subunit SecG [Peptoniphilus sp.]|uniref:Protein-export membrane protein SecG n=1 Tax=Peptoniphilus indolicus TaxID=33030 RepID=A0A379DAV2_9FIRM|nr:MULTISPECIES: preprotein translocase subunit SecG [Peptoniphilus]MDY2986685.1 preprotein translocase subunit SecG [Peptoniphilus sp.]SUB74930.1 preprotein translocase, SecG subunit [Peptoniphilus indolicus]
MELFLTVIIAISSLVLIGTVVVTESAQAGLGTLQGEQSNLWGEHRGTSKKEIENRIITVSSIIFLVSVIALSAI